MGLLSMRRRLASDANESFASMIHRFVETTQKYFFKAGLGLTTCAQRRALQEMIQAMSAGRAAQNLMPACGRMCSQMGWDSQPVS